MNKYMISNIVFLIMMLIGIYVVYIDTKSIVLCIVLGVIFINMEMLEHAIRYVKRLVKL